MTSSSTSVTAQFREIDSVALSFGRCTYNNRPAYNESIREQKKNIIAAERVKMLAWELNAAKEAVVVMTCLLPNAKH